MTGSGRGPVLPSTAVRRRPPPFLPGAVVVAAGLAVAAVAGAACSRRDTSASTRFDAGPPPRRVIGAPPRQVRALPPYAISVDGVGPYRLGVPLTQVLSALPSGPRMTLLQIPGMLDYSVVRDEGLLVGGERQGAASFIAVVAPEIARTEAGLGVGASQDAVVRDLGPALAAPAVAADPALWRGARLPGATFLVEAGRVSGVLITDPRGRAAPPPTAADADGGVAPAPRCDRAALGELGAPGEVFAPACLGGADGVATSGDTIVVAARGAGGARRVATLELRGLRWVAPLEVERGRDELVAVTETVDADARVYAVVALRLDGNRLVRAADSEVYRIDTQRAAWIGAALEDVALHLEVRLDGDALAASGMLVRRSRGEVRDLAPLLPVTVRRRPRGEGDRPRDPTATGSTAGSAVGVDAAVDDEADAGSSVP